MRQPLSFLRPGARMVSRAPDGRDVPLHVESRIGQVPDVPGIGLRSLPSSPEIGFWRLPSSPEIDLRPLPSSPEIGLRPLPSSPEIGLRPLPAYTSIRLFVGRKSEAISGNAGERNNVRQWPISATGSPITLPTPKQNRHSPISKPCRFRM